MTDEQIKETLVNTGFKIIELDDKCIVVTIAFCVADWFEKMEWFDRFIRREGFLKDFAHTIAKDRVCIAYRRIVWNIDGLYGRS